MVFVVVDLGDTLTELRQASPRWLLFAFALTVASRCLMAFKWNLLLRARGLFLPYVEALRVYYASSFVGLLLPATVGQDVIRAMFTKSAERPFVDVASSIIVERLLGFVVLAGAALAGGLALIGWRLEIDLPAGTVLGVPTALLTGTLAVVYLSFTEGARSFFSSVLARLAGWGRIAALADPLQRLFDSYWAYRRHRTTVAIFGVLTGIEIFTLIGWNFAAARSIGIDLSFGMFVIVIPAITLLVRLPITVAGLGVVEATYVFFLGSLGVPPDRALAAGLLAHAVATAAVLPGAVLYGILPRYRRAAKSRRGGTDDRKTGSGPTPAGAIRTVDC